MSFELTYAPPYVLLMQLRDKHAALQCIACANARKLAQLQVVLMPTGKFWALICEACLPVIFHACWCTTWYEVKYSQISLHFLKKLCLVFFCQLSLFNIRFWGFAGWFREEKTLEKVKNHQDLLSLQILVLLVVTLSAWILPSVEKLLGSFRRNNSLYVFVLRRHGPFKTPHVSLISSTFSRQLDPQAVATLCWSFTRDLLITISKKPGTKFIGKMVGKPLGWYP